jgi:hypothetical protein
MPLSADKIAGQQTGDYYHHENNVYKTIAEVRGLDFNTSGTQITNGIVFIVGIRNAVQIMPAAYDYTGSPAGAETLGRFLVPVNARIRSGAQGQFRVGSNPTSQVVLNIDNEGTDIGTITIETDGTAVVNITSTTDLTAGDLLIVESAGAADFVDLYGTLLLEGRG